MTRLHIFILTAAGVLATKGLGLDIAVWDYVRGAGSVLFIHWVTNK